MAGVLIERNGCLRDILHLLKAETWECSWLLTGLECYDYCGWSGCEKWAEETLLLTNRELLYDVDLRDMQFVWGILSAIPARHTREEILAAGLPAFTDTNGRWRCGGETLLPQHPLAFLEIISEDSSTVTVIARDRTLLRPLYGLPEWTEDAEEQNRRFRRLRTMADELVRERGWGRMSEYMRRNLYGGLWHDLYHHRPERAVCWNEVAARFDDYWRGEEKYDG